MNAEEKRIFVFCLVWFLESHRVCDICNGQVKENTMNTISIVSDFSYAWEIIRDYIPLMHARIKAGWSGPSSPWPSILLIKLTYLNLIRLFARFRGW